MFTPNALIILEIAIIITIISMIDDDGAIIRLSSFGGSTSTIRIKYLIVMAFFLFLGVCVKDTYDIGFYREAYELRKAHGKEPLFDIIQFFFHDIGFSFEIFKFIWVAVVAVLLYLGIQKYSEKPEQVAALSFFMVLTSFFIQLRSALAFAIILNFIPLLFTGRVKDRIIYGIVVIICAQFHIVAYVFLLFLIIKRDGKRNNSRGKYYLFLGAVTLCAVGMNAFFVDSLYVFADYLPGLSSVSSRIIENVSGLGTPIKASIFLICKQVMLYILTERACELQVERTSQDMKKTEIISEMNTLSLAFIPLCIINESFARLFNPITIIQYAMILNVGHEKSGIFNSLLFNVTMKALLICMTVFEVLVMLHSNPDDFVRMMNSIQV